MVDLGVVAEDLGFVNGFFRLFFWQFGAIFMAVWGGFVVVWYGFLLVWGCGLEV